MKLIAFFIIVPYSALFFACNDSAPPPPREAGQLEELEDEEDFDTDGEVDDAAGEVIETQDINPRQVTNGLDEEVKAAILDFLDQANLGMLENFIEQDRVVEFQVYMDSENSALEMPDDSTLGIAITYLLGKKLKADGGDNTSTADPTSHVEGGGDETPQDTVDQSIAAATTTIYRLWSIGAKDHMFSTDKNEASSSYQYQADKGFRLFPNPAKGRKPIYRCVSEATGNHFLADNQDCDGSAFNTEGLMGYALEVAGTGTVEMHRCYNNSRTDIFTTSDLTACNANGYAKQKTLGHSFPE